MTDESATPFSQQTVVLTKQNYLELKWEANYWRAQHACLVECGAALKTQVEALETHVTPKSPLGVSVQTMGLLDKYRFGRPTHRLYMSSWSITAYICPRAHSLATATVPTKA